MIGWAIDEHIRADLVQDALAMAITLRGDLPEKVVFHSDLAVSFFATLKTEFYYRRALNARYRRAVRARGHFAERRAKRQFRRRKAS